MHDLRRVVPSLNALFAFEAAARLGSFSNAAAELNVTQAAISYSVRRLETFLGSPLFIREHRRIALTENGRKLYNDVSIGMTHIARSIETIQDIRSGRHVTLSVSTAFAAYWMLPRLARLRQDHPQLDMRLQTTDKDVDLGAEGISLGIRRGDGAWPNYESRLFMPEEIYPVCSPDYLAAAGAIETVADLPDHKLVHLEEPYRPVPDWRDWLGSRGIDAATTSEGLRLNDYALVLQAALDGQGIALGWQHLVQDLLAAGRLVRPVDDRMIGDQGFYVVWPRGLALAQDTLALRDWLLAEAASMQGSA